MILSNKIDPYNHSTCLTLFQCLLGGVELNLTSKLIRNAISGCVQFVKYISASITLRYGTFGPNSSSLSSLRLKGSFFHVKWINYH